MTHRDGWARLAIAALVVALIGGCSSLLGIKDLPGAEDSGADGSAPIDSTTDTMGMAETSPGVDSGADTMTTVDSSQQGDTSTAMMDSSTHDTGTSDAGPTDSGPKDSGPVEASTVCLFSTAGSTFGNCTFAP